MLNHDDVLALCDGSTSVNPPHPPPPPPHPTPAKGPVTWSVDIFFAAVSTNKLFNSPVTGTLRRHWVMWYYCYVWRFPGIILFPVTFHTFCLISTATVTRTTAPKSGQNRWQSQEAERDTVIGSRMFIPTLLPMSWRRHDIEMLSTSLALCKLNVPH